MPTVRSPAGRHCPATTYTYVSIDLTKSYLNLVISQERHSYTFSTSNWDQTILTENKHIIPIGIKLLINIYCVYIYIYNVF